MDALLAAAAGEPVRACAADASACLSAGMAARMSLAATKVRVSERERVHRHRDRLARTEGLQRCKPRTVMT